MLIPMLEMCSNTIISNRCRARYVLSQDFLLLLGIGEDSFDRPAKHSQ